MSEKTWIEKGLEQIAEFTPKTGFNVVAIDHYEAPGDAMYLVSHHKDKGEADKARAAHEKKTKDRSFVYGAKAAK